MTLTHETRRSTVDKLWSPKSLRASLPNCEGKVATTLSRVLGIEQSAPPHVISLALDVSPYGGCLMELANARIKAGDRTAWPLVRQALWFATVGVLGRERLYWFNRHRREFAWERYDADYIVGLWTILAALYFNDWPIVHRLVPVLVRMMRSPQCLAVPGEPQPQYEQKYALARFTGRMLKHRAGIGSDVPEFLEAGAGQPASPKLQRDSLGQLKAGGFLRRTLGALLLRGENGQFRVRQLLVAAMVTALVDEFLCSREIGGR